MTANTSSMPISRAHSKQFIRDMFTIFLGVVIYAFGWTAFILSQDITSGGLAGLTTIIQFATNIPVTYPYYIINGILMVLAFVFVGRKFTFRTLIGVGMIFFVLPFAQALFTPLSTEQGRMVYENLPNFVTNIIPNVGPLLAEDEPFVALVVGAILCGIGMGMVFSANGSTGGTDVVVAIINKYKNISLGNAMIMLDACIVITGAVISHYYGPQYSWTTALGKLAFSVVEIVLVGQMLDYIMNLNKQSVQFLIFSLKHQEISDAITQRLHRGSTILHAQGGYTQKDAKVVLIVARKYQSLSIYRIIKEIDPNAFVSEAVVRGVYGNGFDALDSRSK